MGGPAGIRTQNPPIKSRSNPLLRIAVPRRNVAVRTVASSSHGTTVQLSRNVDRAPDLGHATARWEGFEPSSPGLEPGILAGWTTTARASAPERRRANYLSRVDSSSDRAGGAKCAHTIDDCKAQPSLCFLVQVMSERVRQKALRVNRVIASRLGCRTATTAPPGRLQDVAADLCRSVVRCSQFSRWLHLGMSQVVTLCWAWSQSITIAR
jgi:hypothetical protein